MKRIIHLKNRIDKPTAFFKIFYSGTPETTYAMRLLLAPEKVPLLEVMSHRNQASSMPFMQTIHQLMADYHPITRQEFDMALDQLAEAGKRWKFYEFEELLTATVMESNEKEIRIFLNCTKCQHGQRYRLPLSLRTGAVRCSLCSEIYPYDLVTMNGHPTIEWAFSDFSIKKTSQT